MNERIILTKTQVELTIQYVGEHIVVFHKFDTDNSIDIKQQFIVQIDRPRWEDMGSPETIIATLEPFKTLENK